MTDLILGSEISENVTNRQQAKIQYLQQENNQINEQIKDMEKALRINKDILKLLFDSQNKPNQETIHSKQVLSKLHEENTHLISRLNKLTEDRNMAQNKLLLQQQIQEENLEFYQNLIDDLDQKLLDIKRQIQDKEYQIQDIEKNRIINDKEKEGQTVKIREIVTPNEQSLRLHEELESTKQILSKVSMDTSNLAQDNRQLKETNFNFRRELIKLRVVLRSPVIFQKMKDFVYEDYFGNMDDNLELQKEIYENPGYLLNHYNYEIENQFNNQNSDVLSQYGYQQPGQTQIKQLQNNERAIYQEKLQKSEALLKGFKELFEREKNKSHLLQTKIGEIKRQLDNTTECNQIILKAISSKEEKHRNCIGEISYYKQQYGNYMYLLQNKREAKLNLSFEKAQKTPTLGI